MREQTTTEGGGQPHLILYHAERCFGPDPDVVLDRSAGQAERTDRRSLRIAFGEASRLRSADSAGVRSPLRVRRGCGRRPKYRSSPLRLSLIRDAAAAWETTSTSPKLPTAGNASSTRPRSLIQPAGRSGSSKSLATPIRATVLSASVATSMGWSRRSLSRWQSRSARRASQSSCDSSVRIRRASRHYPRAHKRGETGSPASPSAAHKRDASRVRPKSSRS